MDAIAAYLERVPDPVHTRHARTDRGGPRKDQDHITLKHEFVRQVRINTAAARSKGGYTTR